MRKYASLAGLASVYAMASTEAPYYPNPGNYTGTNEFNSCICMINEMMSPMKRIQRNMQEMPNLDPNLYDVYQNSMLPGMFDMMTLGQRYVQDKINDGALMMLGVASTDQINSMMDGEDRLLGPYMQFFKKIIDWMTETDASRNILKDLINFDTETTELFNSVFVQPSKNNFWNLATYLPEDAMDGWVDSPDTLLIVMYDFISAIMENLDGDAVIDGFLLPMLAKFEQPAINLDNFMSTQYGSDFMKMVIRNMIKFGEFEELKERYDEQGLWDNYTFNIRNRVRRMAEDDPMMDMLMENFGDYMTAVEEYLGQDGENLEKKFENFEKSDSLEEFLRPYEEAHGEDATWEPDFSKDAMFHEIMAGGPYEGKLSPQVLAIRNVVQDNKYRNLVKFLVDFSKYIWAAGPPKSDFVENLTPVLAGVFDFLPDQFNHQHIYYMVNQMLVYCYEELSMDEIVERVSRNYTPDDTNYSCECDYPKEFPDLPELEDGDDNHHDDHDDEHDSDDDHDSDNDDDHHDGHDNDDQDAFPGSINFDNCAQTKPYHVGHHNIHDICRKAMNPRQFYDDPNYPMLVMGQCFSQKYNQNRGVYFEDEQRDFPEFEQLALAGFYDEIADSEEFGAIQAKIMAGDRNVTQVVNKIREKFGDKIDNEISRKMSNLKRFKQLQKECYNECLTSVEDMCSTECIDRRTSDEDLSWDDNCMGFGYIKKMLVAESEFTDDARVELMEVANCMAEKFRNKSVRDQVLNYCSSNWCMFNDCSEDDSDDHHDVHNDHHDDDRDHYKPGTAPTFNINFNGMPLKFEQNGNDWNQEGGPTVGDNSGRMDEILKQLAELKNALGNMQRPGGWEDKDDLSVGENDQNNQDDEKEDHAGETGDHSGNGDSDGSDNSNYEFKSVIPIEAITQKFSQFSEQADPEALDQVTQKFEMCAYLTFNACYENDSKIAAKFQKMSNLSKKHTSIPSFEDFVSGVKSSSKVAKDLNTVAKNCRVYTTDEVIAKVNGMNDAYEIKAAHCKTFMESVLPEVVAMMKV